MKRAREEAQKKGERKKRGERRMERKKRRRREKRGSGCIDRGPAAPGAWADGRRRRRACCRERQVGWARVGFFSSFFYVEERGKTGLTTSTASTASSLLTLYGTSDNHHRQLQAGRQGGIKDYYLFQ